MMKINLNNSFIFNTYILFFFHSILFLDSFSEFTIIFYISTVPQCAVADSCPGNKLGKPLP